MNIAKKKYIILSVIIGSLLVLPAIQMHTNLFPVDELKGSFKPYEKPKLSLNNWFSGSFQENYNDYFENNFGFRPWFVRIRNQLSFSLCGSAKANGVVIGEDFYLYESYYLNAYNGLNYLGYETLKSRVDSLMLIHDSLASHGTELLICFAVGKGSFYPEFFPDNYKNQSSDSTNYLKYKNLFELADFNVIDFNSWFLQMKDTSRFILYPKYGTHWSEYGSVIAADSLLRYVEDLKNIDLPDLVIDKIQITNHLKGSDYDIGECLNLLFQLPSQEMAYPQTSWRTEGKDSLNVIVISDSFYWQLFNRGMGTVGFKPGMFWFYNKISYPGSIDISDLDYVKCLYNADLVILLATEATLARFPFGFIKDFYSDTALIREN